MPNSFQFDFALALWIGLPLLAASGFFFWRRNASLARPRRIALLVLRMLAMLLLVGLAARPVWVRQENPSAQHPVILLIDRSQSMSLNDGGGARYGKALELLRNEVLPGLKSAKLNSRALLFAAEAQPATPREVVEAKPDGSSTDLANAIEQALAGESPSAILALTDGASNQPEANGRALSALLGSRVPFFAVGFGTEEGASTLNIRRLDAPPVAPPKQKFTIGVQLEATAKGTVPDFTVSLFRDGQLVETRRIASFSGSRFWLESFTVQEPADGLYHYSSSIDLAPDAKFIVANRSAAADVRVSDEKAFRILFAQGALTWDFKFIARALENDPTVKLTGLSRTSSHSIFRQNVEAAGELLEGFPSKLEAMAPFRVVVLSDLRPTDFNPAQQETLARFCRELGGGVLLIGGPSTFGPEWQGSILEQLLPVRFDPTRGVSGLEKPFHFRVTDEALRMPAFQIAPQAENRAAWDKIPAFLQYGRVLDAKPGATVLAVHDTDVSTAGKRVLMASQRYGAGQSAIICVQNFWRWRLARDTDTEQFDRFWRQLLRWLGETSRQPFEISFPSQDLKLGQNVDFIVERPAAAAGETLGECTLQVVDAKGETLLERKLDATGRQLETFTFTPKKEGLHTVRVKGALGQELASRSIEIQDANVEFQQTARDMETLRQWASMSKGIAVPHEEWQSAKMIPQIVQRIATAREAKRQRIPLGLNATMLAVVLAALGGEWILRRKWNLR